MQSQLDCFNYQELVRIDVAVEAPMQAIRANHLSVSSILNFIQFEKLDAFKSRELLASIDNLATKVRICFNLSAK